MKIASFKSLLCLVTLVVINVDTCNAVKRNRIGKIRHNLKQLYKNIPGVNSVLLSEKIAILYALQKTYDKNKERSAISKVNNLVLYLQTQMHIFQGREQQRLDDYFYQYCASQDRKPWNVFIAERQFIPVPTTIVNKPEQKTVDKSSKKLMLTLSKLQQHMLVEDTAQTPVDNKVEQKPTLDLNELEQHLVAEQSNNTPTLSNSPRSCVII